MAKKSKFEIAIVDNVKAVRTEKGLTQDDIAAFLNVTRGFIGQIESPNSASKYNFDHLNTLAWEMDCSPKDFMPEKAIVDGKSR
jgi:transcriptional regulator with XRE-family HTH domain